MISAITIDCPFHDRNNALVGPGGFIRDIDLRPES
jgi:hypothetical protein